MAEQTGWEKFQDMDFGQKLGVGASTLAEWYSMARRAAPIDRDAMARMESPLLESYQGLQDMSKQLADPNSALNQQSRNEIRTQNLEGFSDIASRARSMATGEYGEYASKPLQAGMMGDAISQALSNYSAGRANRLAQSADLKYKAGAVGQHLASMRADQWGADQARRRLQGTMFETELSDVMDWFGKKV